MLHTIQNRFNLKQQISSYHLEKLLGPEYNNYLTYDQGNYTHLQTPGDLDDIQGLVNHPDGNSQIDTASHVRQFVMLAPMIGIGPDEVAQVSSVVTSFANLYPNLFNTYKIHSWG